MVKPASKFHHDHCICDNDIDTIERYRGEETKTITRRMHQPATAPGMVLTCYGSWNGAVYSVTRQAMHAITHSTRDVT